ncbi:MAG TPA: energy transducer TonB [Candidatus Angelobacter sp.]|nr:energy transducer TonB [Candidatus Angelobacter sp.]
MSDAMNHLSVYDELDRAIEQMLASPDVASFQSEETQSEENVGELMGLAADLRYLPRENFKTRLRLELEWEAAGRTVSASASQETSRAVQPDSSQILPSLFGKTWAGYPARRMNFVLSVALHGMVAFLMSAGFFMVKSFVPHMDPSPHVIVRLEPYPVPVGSKPSDGGGSGGAADKTPASRGVAPRAAREQLTPPIVMQNNMQPKLVAEATVIAPPDLNFPRMRELGDPLSDLARASNGAGVSGGIGGNYGTGVGGEGGSGRGPDSGGGCCGGLYSIGNGVSMPRAIYAPEPEFSEEARKKKYQGEVTLLATIGADGIPRNLVVVRSLGMGLDEKALEGVRTWRFEPAKKGGHPVAVQMNIIVNFNLF